MEIDIQMAAFFEDKGSYRVKLTHSDPASAMWKQISSNF